MLLPSTGLTCTTFWSNEARFTSGTRITVPDSSAGSMRPISFSTAMIEAYSVPWAPETTASTLPGRAPWITSTGMLVAASAPAGTSIVPVATWPRSARAVPTVKVSAPTGVTNARRATALSSFMAGIISPRDSVASGHRASAVGGAGVRVEFLRGRPGG